MAYRKQDENGRYREVDPKTGLFIDDIPLASSLGQVEHQTVATMDGRVIDHNEEVVDIIGTNGLPIVPEDEEKIKAFVKEAISIDNLVATFHENSHDTLLRLLALQDNKHPLKKGGVGIAYRTDALIMHCKMEFTANENIVFDAILGVMSSFPENDTYRIEPSSFIKYQKYDNEKTLYNVFKKGAEKLKNRFLTFDELGIDGDDEIVVPWFEILRYHGKKNGENSFIEFRPTAFFKDLALCSQLVHGAYGSLEVTTQLRGKYTIAVYWFLENRKRYREYPGATPGIFDLSIDEMKHQFSLPVSYKVNDIERRVIGPARDSINGINECDFTFEYEQHKVSGKVEGFRFIVREKNYVDEKPKAKQIAEDPLYEQIGQVLGMTGIQFSDEEINRIFSCAKRNNKTAIDMMTIALAFKGRFDNTDLEPIEDKVSYICTMITQGTSQPSASSEVNEKKNKSSFNNFSQRDVDMNELEQVMLNKNN